MASGNEAVTVEQLARAIGVPAPAPPLPSGYTRLEYIESDGRQYIDTGVKPDSTMRVKASFDPVSTKDTFIFGARPSWNSSDLFVLLHAASPDSLRDDWGNEKTSVPRSSVPISGTIDVDKNANETTFNGSYVVTHGELTWSGTSNLYVFSCNENGVAKQPTKARVRSFDMWKSGEKVRGLVPARRASDGAVGMYDTVAGAFLANSGTGAFKAGPEVATATVNGAEDAVVTLKQFKVATGKLSGGGSGGGEDWPDPLTATPAQLKEASERLTESNMQSAIDFYAPFIGKSRQLGGWQATLAGVCHDTRPDGRKALTTWVFDEMYTLGSVVWGHGNSAVDGWPDSKLRGVLNEYMQQELTSDVVDAVCEVVKDSFYFDMGVDPSPRIVASTDKFFIPSLAELGINKATIIGTSLDIKDGEKYAFVDGSAFAAVGTTWTRSSYSIYGSGMEAFEIVDSQVGYSPLSVSSRSSVVPFLCI